MARHLEVRTADGKLMTTVIAALDTHRSDLYSEKIRRAMQAAKEQGFPPDQKSRLASARSERINGRFVAIEF